MQWQKVNTPVPQGRKSMMTNDLKNRSKHSKQTPTLAVHPHLH